MLTRFLVDFGSGLMFVKAVFNRNVFLYKRELDFRVMIVCCLLTTATMGCSKTEVVKPVAQVSDVKASEQALLAKNKEQSPESAPETEASKTDSAEDDRHCPTSNDVAKSITEFKLLYKDAQSILHDYKNAGRNGASEELKSKASQWQKQNTSWSLKNNHLIDWSELLLGADGTETAPEIPVSLKILKNADDWMCKALIAADSHEFTYSKVYLSSAFKALNKARNVANHVIGAHSRAASSATPKAIREAEKKMTTHCAQKPAGRSS